MLKFLRKYQLILLAVAGSLLMVIFLIGPAINQFGPNPLKRRVATIGPAAEKVTQLQLNLARADVEIIRSVIDEPLRLLGQAGILESLGVDPTEGEDHWFLLTRAAEDAGLVGESSDGKALVDGFARDLGRGLVQAQLFQGQDLTAEDRQRIIDETVAGIDDRVTRAAGRYQTTKDFIYRTFSRLAGVQRLVRLYSGAPRLSTPRTMAVAEEAGAQAFADVAVIGPAAVAQTIDEPSDDELWAHVQRFADIAPGDVRPGEDDDNPLGLGYRQPNRVKLEYLELSRTDVLQAVEIDRIEVRKRWQRENPDAEPADFESDRAALEAEVRREKAEEILDVADQIVRGALLEYTRGLEGVAGGYRRLPDDWRSQLPDLANLAQRVVEGVRDRTGLTIPLPVVNRIEDRWLTSNDIRALPGLGRASFRVGPRTIPAAAIADELRELDGDDNLLAQVGVPIINPSYARNESTGSSFYITVLDAAGPSAPDSLEPVRDAARIGYRRLRAYETLTGMLPTLIETAATQGLDALPTLFEDEAAKEAVTAGTARDVLVTNNSAFITTAGGNFSVLQALRADADVRKAIRDAAMSLDPLAPIDSAPAGETTMGHASPAQQAVVIARIRAFRPLTREAFLTSADNLANQTARSTVVEITRDLGDDAPFSYQSLKDRYTYVRLETREDDAEEAEAASTEDSDA